MAAMIRLFRGTMMREYQITQDAEEVQLQMYEDGKQVAGALFVGESIEASHKRALEVAQGWGKPIL